ncbi:hypothetical protein [Mycolicibacterium grossiae]|uniref:hypothetical protein n=1 Tax=Mycolicibacterium grossiae TaxID=1552759 RepID=UPI000F776D26|nr:hypothetical protein [Mycolicibacterium grossiae]QEM46607.1 hypothetical protein FZ046_19155 [Mycolicibacterium grossiae]
MGTDWTPEEVADLKNVIAIVGSAAIDGTEVVNAQGRLDNYLTNLESATRTATAAVNLCGLLLEHLVQTEQKNQDYTRVLLRAMQEMQPEGRGPLPDAPGPRSYAQILKFVSDTLPSM